MFIGAGELTIAKDTNYVFKKQMPGQFFLNLGTGRASGGVAAPQTPGCQEDGLRFGSAGWDFAGLGRRGGAGLAPFSSPCGGGWGRGLFRLAETKCQGQSDAVPAHPVGIELEQPRVKSREQRTPAGQKPVAVQCEPDRMSRESFALECNWAEKENSGRRQTPGLASILGSLGHHTPPHQR